MIKSIESLLNLKTYSSALAALEPYLQQGEFIKDNKLSLTSKDGNNLFDNTGPLFNLTTHEMLAHTSEFTTLNKVFENTIVEELVAAVKKYSEQQLGYCIGRVRVMRLLAKTCYSYHMDHDDFRLHVPLFTNEKCFFIVEENIFRMNEVFNLYKLKTNVLHTAVNASFQHRDHLVFDTYKK